MLSEQLWSCLLHTGSLFKCKVIDRGREDSSVSEASAKHQDQSSDPQSSHKDQECGSVIPASGRQRGRRILGAGG